ncbi:hypothetical protein CEP54_015060 [Fusarium duplospermum]|uniref:Uncharacterized protein n=1 Tax=Fusarium duplospermum TaxID=1325734 RepID=A0A428NRY4_9HYPO|nr:hypothetical protein CEP54_015060 [Fusarium duplospermum]
MSHIGPQYESRKRSICRSTTWSVTIRSVNRRSEKTHFLLKSATSQGLPVGSITFEARPEMGYELGGSTD